MECLAPPPLTVPFYRHSFTRFKPCMDTIGEWHVLGESVVKKGVLELPLMHEQENAHILYAFLGKNSLTTERNSRMIRFVKNMQSIICRNAHVNMYIALARVKFA